LTCAGRHDPPQILAEATEAILATVDMQAVLERTGRLLRRHFGQTRVTIHRRVEGDPPEVEVLLTDDPKHPTQDKGVRFPLEGSACGRAMADRQRVVVDPIDGVTPRFREEVVLARLGYGSLVCFPLVFEGHVLGTLDIAHTPHDGLLACCVQTAEQVSRLVAMALHNSMMVEEVRRLNRLLDRENSQLREEIRQYRKDARYVAESAGMKQVLERVRMVAASDTTVLIRGETGTGKEGLARLVHDHSPRFGGPFVVVNLGAIPESLVESELFGHEKGAFTGALRRKAGRFEQAEGGTIFLDEVGDAPPSLQVKLLRVLQEKEVQRVGGTETRRVDTRVVAATNRPLEGMVQGGSFRSDLYYRLNVFPIQVPPLRERLEDVRPLVTYFLARQAERMHRKPPRVPDAAWRVLEAGAWPGNVRELENHVQRALLGSPGDVLVLPEGLPAPSTATAAAGPAAPPGRFDDEVRCLLQRALQATGGRVYGPGGAAALLGIPPTTLQGKLLKLGLARGGSPVEGAAVPW
jgi:formate hydrogenlyase transcriptional activator